MSSAIVRMTDVSRSSRAVLSPRGASMVCGVVLLLAAGATTARADLTLTAAGLSRNFQLTTFISGYPTSGGLGPVGIDYQNDGTVLVSEYASSHIRRFSNVDGQVYTNGVDIGYPGTEFPHDIAHLGSTVYVSHYSSQSVEQLNPDGSVNHVVASGFGNARSLKVNPATGHFLVSTVQGIRDIDPITGIVKNLNSVEVDGMAVSSDGSMVYGSVLSNGPGGHVVGYSTTTGLAVFDSGFVGNGGADGVTLGFGQFLGNLYVNCTNGQVWEVSLANSSQTLIATGGSRGDFVSSDATGTGDMLLTQSDRVLRLSGIPTPAASTLLGFGLLGTMSRRRR